MPTAAMVTTAVNMATVQPREDLARARLGFTTRAQGGLTRAVLPCLRLARGEGSKWSTKTIGTQPRHGEADYDSGKKGGGKCGREELGKRRCSRWSELASSATRGGSK